MSRAKKQPSGCGAVGKAVASNIKGPGFESSHRQLLLNIFLLLTVCGKDENKEKEAGNGPFKKRKTTNTRTYGLIWLSTYIKVKYPTYKVDDRLD